MKILKEDQLTKTEKKALDIIFQNTIIKNTDSFVISNDQLSMAIECSVKSVQRIKKRFVELGLIKIISAPICMIHTPDTILLTESFCSRAYNYFDLGADSESNKTHDVKLKITSSDALFFLEYYELNSCEGICSDSTMQKIFGLFAKSLFESFSD